MGKADNIKRARKLKEAKKQRERETLRAEGHDTGSIEIQKRAETKVQLNETGAQYSQLLEEFAQPLLETGDTAEVLKSKYNLAVLAWNAALKKEDDEAGYQQLKTNLLAKPGFARFANWFEEMVTRKAEKFADHKQVIADFAVKKVKDKYQLTVAVYH